MDVCQSFRQYYFPWITLPFSCSMWTMYISNYKYTTSQYNNRWRAELLWNAWAKRDFHSVNKWSQYTRRMIFNYKQTYKNDQWNENRLRKPKKYGLKSICNVLVACKNVREEECGAFSARVDKNWVNNKKTKPHTHTYKQQQHNDNANKILL